MGGSNRLHSAGMSMKNNRYSHEEHQRMADAVLRKIARVCDVEPEALTLPEKNRTVLERDVESYLTSGAWETAREQQIHFCALPDTARNTLDNAARKILLGYLEALHVREYALALPTDKISSHNRYLYGPLFTREYLADTYINHFSNQVQKQLYDCGLNQRGMISLHGSLIKTALALHQPYSAREANFVEPVVNAESPPSAEEREDQTNNYWRTMHDQLQMWHRSMSYGPGV